MKIILFTYVIIISLSGCFDVSGRGVCRDSLNNLCLPDGYILLDYNSDYICCNEDAYFVWFLISDGNNTYWIGERPNEWFQYWYEDDELNYYGKNSTLKSWICN